MNNGDNAGAKKVVYLHLVGVQEIDNATNDFLYTIENGKTKQIEYHFKLIVHSEPATSNPVVNSGQE